MAEISEYDLALLSYLGKSKVGRDLDDINKRFKNNCSSVLSELVENQFLEKVNQDLTPFLPSGSTHKFPPVGNFVVTKKGTLEISRYKFSKSIANHQKWKERIIGFLFGIVTAIAAAAISNAIHVIGWL